MWIKRLRKLFFICLFTGLAVFAGLATMVYAYRDTIIAHFVAQANKQLNTPVATEKIAISFWQDFPNVAITLDEVRVQESIPGSLASLASAKRLAFSFYLWDVWEGQYNIRNLQLEDAEIRLRVSKTGIRNFDIFKSAPKEEDDADSQPVQFALEKIVLSNVHFSYLDLKNEQEFNLLAERLGSSLLVEGDRYFFRTSGKLVSDVIKLGSDRYLSNVPLELNSRFAYLQAGQAIEISEAAFAFDEGRLNLNGSWQWASDQLLDLKFSTEDLSLATLKTALPQRFIKPIEAYQCRGKLAASGKIEGTLSESVNPVVQLDFSLADGALVYPENKEQIRQLSLKGSFSNGKQQRLQSSALLLDHYQFVLDDEPIRGSLALTNLEDYHLTLSAQGKLQLAAFLRFYPIENLQEAAGQIDGDVQFKGRLADLKQAKTLTRLQLSGNLLVNQLGFQWKNLPYRFHQWQGALTFNENDLALSNLQGYAGESQFLINGLFKNILGYLLLEDQPLTIEADLKSENLNLDELLADQQDKSTAASRRYAFNINPSLALDFNCSVEQLKFERFRAKDISGRLKVAQAVADIDQVKLKAAGGSIQLAGRVDARMPNLVKVSSNATFDDIFIDSVFYVFRNFSQDFLMDRHLQGRLTAQVESSMMFDKKLRFAYDKLQAKASMRVREGELRDFEPLQELSRFIHEDKLAHVSFSELNSSVEIRNKTVFLPETRIQTDISTLQLSGTHTFSQHINYGLKVPVRTILTGKRKSVPKGASGQEKEQGLHLMLRIVGTTDDYHISYDTDAVAEKLANDLKEEGKELKEVFQTQGEVKKDAVQLEEDEYFDW